MYESPPRWNMDLLLKPYDDCSFYKNSMIGNIINVNNYSDLVYSTIKISGLNFPLVWGANLGLGRNVKNFSWLASHMVSIRGCDMNRDGHDVNNVALESPKVGYYSFSGILSNQSKSIFPAVALMGVEVEDDKSLAVNFKSPSGREPLVSQKRDKNLFNQLLGLFRDMSLSKEKNGLDEFLNTVNGQKLIPDLEEQLSRIRRLNFKKMEADYLIFQKKYELLVADALNGKCIFDKNCEQIKGLLLPQRFKKNEGEVEIDDYIGKYKCDDYYVGNNSIVDIFSKAKMNSLVNQFAFLELSIKYELSRTFMIMVDPIHDLSFENSYEQSKVKWRDINENEIEIFYEDKLYTTPKGKIDYLNTDAHNVGIFVSHVGFSKYYLAIMYCISEFMKSLKEFDVKEFEETLIHLTSEFEREPRPNGSGSEHGWTGHTSTLFSGSFKTCQVLGNIFTNSNSDTDFFKNSGTWGKGAPVGGLDRAIRYNDILNSIANLFGVESPFGGSLLFELKDGKILSKIERARNV